MLCVKVGLGAVRARELSISILDRDYRVLRASGGSSRTSRRAGKNAPAALRAHDMRRLVGSLRNRHLLVLLVGSNEVVGGLVGRGHARLLRDDTARRHGSQDRRVVASTSRSRRNWLRTSSTRRGLRHHRVRCAIGVRGRVLALLRHRVDATSAARLRSLRLVARQIVVRIGRVGRARGPRRVRVAPVDGVHVCGGWLQGRKGLRKRRASLKLMGRNRGWRRVRVS